MDAFAAQVQQEIDSLAAVVKSLPVGNKSAFGKYASKLKLIPIRIQSVQAKNPEVGNALAAKFNELNTDLQHKLNGTGPYAAAATPAATPQPTPAVAPSPSPSAASSTSGRSAAAPPSGSSSSSSSSSSSAAAAAAPAPSAAASLPPAIQEAIKKVKEDETYFANISDDEVWNGNAVQRWQALQKWGQENMQRLLNTKPLPAELVAAARQYNAMAQSVPQKINTINRRKPASYTQQATRATTTATTPSGASASAPASSSAPAKRPLPAHLPYPEQKIVDVMNAAHYVSKIKNVPVDQFARQEEQKQWRDIAANQRKLANQLQMPDHPTCQPKVQAVEELERLVESLIAEGTAKVANALNQVGDWQARYKEIKALFPSGWMEHHVTLQKEATKQNVTAWIEHLKQLREMHPKHLAYLKDVAAKVFEARSNAEFMSYVGWLESSNVFRVVDNALQRFNNNLLGVCSSVKAPNVNESELLKEHFYESRLKKLEEALRNVELAIIVDSYFDASSASQRREHEELMQKYQAWLEAYPKALNEAKEKIEAVARQKQQQRDAMVKEHVEPFVNGGTATAPDGSVWKYSDGQLVCESGAYAGTKASWQADDTEPILRLRFQATSDDLGSVVLTHDGHLSHRCRYGTFWGASRSATSNGFARSGGEALPVSNVEGLVPIPVCYAVAMFKHSMERMDDMRKEYDKKELKQKKEEFYLNYKLESVRKKAPSSCKACNTSGSNINWCPDCGAFFCKWCAKTSNVCPSCRCSNAGGIPYSTSSIKRPTEEKMKKFVKKMKRLGKWPFQDE